MYPTGLGAISRWDSLKQALAAKSSQPSLATTVWDQIRQRSTPAVSTASTGVPLINVRTTSGGWGLPATTPTTLPAPVTQPQPVPVTYLSPQSGPVAVAPQPGGLPAAEVYTMEAGEEEGGSPFPVGLLVAGGLLLFLLGRR